MSNQDWNQIAFELMNDRHDELGYKATTTSVSTDRLSDEKEDSGERYLLNNSPVPAGYPNNSEDEVMAFELDLSDEVSDEDWADLDYDGW